MDGRPPGRGTRRAGRWLRRGGAALVAAGLAFAAAWQLFPLADHVYRTPPAARVLTDRDDHPLRIGLAENDVYALPLDAIPRNAWLPQALIAVEDQRFYRHIGVDPLALLRAVGQNIAGRRVISGASTISTQVIRLTEPRPRTLGTKVIEAFRALQLEAHFTKDDILLMYLNRAPFGGNLVGAQAASRRYFGKNAADLSLAEAALLAGLPQSPSRLAPNRNPDAARVRRRTVLDRMLACGWISREQHGAAMTEPVVVRAETYPFEAPHFSAWALRQIASGAGGGPVRTTLDRGLQRMVETQLRQHERILRDAGVDGAAVVVVDVRHAAIRAMTGSPDPADSVAQGQVNAAVAARSAGSTLKPFLYAWAADHGRLTPERRLMDVPKIWRGFEPGNYDGGYLGPVPARAALAMSLNLPALELAEEVGAERLLGLLRTLGFRTLDRTASDYGISLALGGAEVRLTELADACAALARGGAFVPSRWREDAPMADERRIFSAEAAWMVNDMLSGAERQGEALGHVADAALPRAAWKTGTSSGRRDGWCVAWNPDWVVAVWTGDPRGRPCPRLSGGETAAPLAWNILRELYPDGRGPWYARPAGIHERAVCAVSGQPPGPACADTIPDGCVDGVSDPLPCAVHQFEWTETSDGSRIAQVTEHWPPRVAAFLRARAHRSSVSETNAANPAPQANSDRLVIEYPKSGSVFRRTGLEHEQILFRACAPDTDVCWFVNGRPVQWTAPGEALPWTLERGRHQILCADRRGRSAQAVFTVE